MVYREHALNAPGEVDDDPNRSLLAIDASGRAGPHAGDASGGADGRGAGADGQPGRNARAAGVGQAGGRVSVTIASASQEPRAVRVYGRCFSASGTELESEEHVVRFDAGGFVDLAAMGGRGGDGGAGGRGGDGARGRSGSNATRYSSGTDGGPGGDGGDGGLGSSGGAGGMGGEIQVTVDVADTHLLMLVRP
ncbi:MAG: hypothetical protein AB8I08_38850, partial [Sandaracinaceae bacterium]